MTRLLGGRSPYTRAPELKSPPGTTDCKAGKFRYLCGRSGRSGINRFPLALRLKPLLVSVSLPYSKPSRSMLKTGGLTSLTEVIACDNLAFSAPANSTSAGSE